MKIIVLGDKLHANNKMSSNLKSRLDKCIEVYKTNNLIIVCGGNNCGRNCYHTEAYVMKKYLLDNSTIPKNKIILERNSLNTIENIKKMKLIVQKYKYDSLSIISSKWHLHRVKFICQIFLKKKITFVPTFDTVNSKRLEHEKNKIVELKKIYKYNLNDKQ